MSGGGLARRLASGRLVFRFDSESDLSGDFSDDELVEVPYKITWSGIPLRWWSEIPLCLDPSDGVLGRFNLAALCGCHTLNVRYVTAKSL